MVGLQIESKGGMKIGVSFVYFALSISLHAITILY